MADLYVCPGTFRSGPRGSTTKQWLLDLATSPPSYVYLGKGLTTDCPPETVILYEPLSNHERGGINVLRADGKVFFYGGPRSTKWIKSLSTTTRPTTPS